MLFEQEQLPEGSMAAAWEYLETRKSVTERVVDIVSIPWYIAESSFAAHYTKRKDYEGFDEVICGLLLAEAGCDSSVLRAALGLDAELGDKVLNAMIDPLEDTMIEGDSSYWELTERGRTYAREGRKFERNNCKFGLVTDLQDGQGLSAHVLKAAMGEWKVTGPEITNAATIKDHLRNTWAKEGKIIECATVQVPSYHQPNKGFYLEEPELRDMRILAATVWVGVLEDFSLQQHHLHAFNPVDGKEVAAISKILNAPAGDKTRERVWVAIRKKNEAQIVSEPAPSAQAEDEKWVLEKVKAMETLQEDERKRASAAMLQERKSFDTLEFEQELERVSQKCRGEWWLISPWIRAAAWSKRRRQLERALANGATIFLGYSEAHNAGDEMVPSDVLKEMQLLQARQPKLFVAQLPQFHEKIMYAEVDGQQYDYTGSFNLLSFAAGNQERIGRENMRRLQWGDDSTTNRNRHLAGFQAYYAARWSQALQACASADITDRKTILDADRKLAELVTTHSPFATHVGGPENEAFQAKCTAEKERFRMAFSDWHLRQLQAEIQELKSSDSLSKSTADSKLRSTLDRLKTDRIPESQFATELQTMRTLLDHLSLKAEIAQWENELATNPTTITESEGKRMRQKLDQWRSRFPHAEQQAIEQAQQTAEAQLKAKLPEVGLKVLGKIDLPPQSSSNKKQKKKKKK